MPKQEFPQENNIKSENAAETPKSYAETCHKFKLENERYYTKNNFYRGTVIPLDRESEISHDTQTTLEDIKRHYQENGDSFGRLLVAIKLGEKEKSYQIADEILENSATTEKAHTARVIWNNFKDKAWKEKAIELFGQLEKQYEETGDNLLAAVNSDILRKLTKDGTIKEKAINFHRKFADQRAEKRDTWWRAISLREIAKISKNEQDIDIASVAAEYEIERAIKAGSYKNAGLWARDLVRLKDSPENRRRAEELLTRQIEISKQSGDTRSAAKSYWEMWKATGKEEYRRETLQNYKKLLEEAKQKNDKNKIEECYRVLLYLTQ